MLNHYGCYFQLLSNVFKFMQQKFERKNQRNKRFITLFTNVQYASPWLHGTHQNGIPFLAKLEQSISGFFKLNTCPRVAFVKFQTTKRFLLSCKRHFNQIKGKLMEMMFYAKS